MAILLASSYVIGALWVAASIGWWLFNKFDYRRHISSRVKRVLDACGTVLGMSTVLLLFLWIGACISRNEQAHARRKREKEVQLNLTRKQFENTYSNVFELLRERNKKELELRLAYNRRAARMIEEINSNSFSFTESPYTNFPPARLDRLFILDLRCDTDLVLGKLKEEAEFPLGPFELIEGGAVQFYKDSLLQSD